ncbi:lipopolysaccharide biosynthesis protein [Cellulomonas alba]|uniref:Lipopolysaccharide biosynthesis protein n=1 Tax=Cellulomonas alba TaxID=3053467 RepID=A0ABT7SHA6_9CELL|nr:lipopolysaccharide biosynthesis protein [Cellulomonas alba]MDM7855578.1 lipopolysaccharide biosynthesis protein [Cellulomonas alba]
MSRGAAPERDTSNLASHAARGALSTGLGLSARLVIQTLSVVVLARVLEPRDYGLVAMVLAIVGIGDTLRDFGLSSAAIQAPDLSRAQRSNLFWTNTAIGLALGLAVLAIAEPVAAFYHQSELVPITRALAVTFLLNGMMTQLRADLVRSMRFQVVATIDVVAPGSALVLAVVLASLGAGYWALVAQQLVVAVVALIGCALAARWLPSRYDRTVPMRHLYRFGGNLLGSQLVGYLANNVDALTIGHRFGATPLGIYNRAFQLLMNPLNQVRAPSTTVALPVLARAGYSKEYDKIVRTGQLMLAYPVTLGLSVLAGVAVPTVDILLGDAWSQVPPILRFLAVAGIFQTLAYVGYWVYLSRGLTKQLLHYTLVSSAIRIVCVVGGSIWGVVGVAAGYALAPMLAWPLSLWWLNRVTRLPVRSLYGGAARVLVVGLAAGLGSGGTAWALRSAPSIVELVAGVAAGLAVAALVILAVPALRRDVPTVRSAVRAALRRPRRGASGHAGSSDATAAAPAVEAAVEAVVDALVAEPATVDLPDALPAAVLDDDVAERAADHAEPAVRVPAPDEHRHV